MRCLLFLCLGLGLLAACSSTPPGVRPVKAGVSRADGIVTMESTGTIYNPVSADWQVAQSKATRQCRSWGYDGDSNFSGWQEACRAYDIYGRCTGTKVTRFYSCDDS
jgi:hypothetical protein